MQVASPLGNEEHEKTYDAYYSQSQSFPWRLLCALPPPPPGPPPPGFGCPAGPPPLPPGCPLPPPPLGCPPFQQQQPTNSSIQQPFLNTTSEEIQTPPFPTQQQQLAVAYIPKFMALLSVLCSSWITYEILIKDRKKLRSIYHKIIALMSATDILSSIWFFVGNWAIPKELAFVVGGAAGTQATCQVQAFFIQLGIATPLYNISLAVYSLLLIRYRWRESQLQRSRIAKFLFLGLPLIFGLGTATTGLVLPLYSVNQPTNTCGITLLPNRSGDDVSLQARRALVIAFVLAPLWLTLLLLLIETVLVVQTVRKQQLAASRWDFGNSHAASMALSRPFRQQSVKFLGNSSNRKDTSRVSFKLSNNNGTSRLDDEGAQFFSSSNSHGHHGSKSKEDMQGNNIVPDHLSNTPNVSPAGLTNLEDNVTTNNAKTSSSASTTKRLRDFLCFKQQQRTESTPSGPDSLSIAAKKANNKRRIYSRSRKVVVQSIFFVGAFIITWIFYMAFVTKNLVQPRNNLAIEFISSFLLPGQGFFNFIVFVRPRYVQYRELHPEWSIVMMVKMVLKATFCTTPRRQKHDTDKPAKTEPIKVAKTNNNMIASCALKEATKGLTDGIETSEKTKEFVSFSNKNLESESALGDAAGLSAKFRMTSPSSDESSTSSQELLTTEIDATEEQPEPLKELDDSQAPNQEKETSQAPDENNRDVTVEEHEDWLYADLPEKEFEIMFYSYEFSVASDSSSDIEPF